MRKNALLPVLILLTVSFLNVALPLKAALGTITVPNDYPTIQEAINAATAGDTIFVRSGTYQENPINTTKSLSIVGEGRQSTIINFECPAFTNEIYGHNITSYGRAIEVNASNFTFSGFNVNSNGGDISFFGNRITIADNRIAAPFSAKGNYLNVYNNTFEWTHFEGGYGVNYSYHFQIDSMFSRFCQNMIYLQKFGPCTATFGGKYNVITDNTISGALVYVVSTPCFFSGNKILNSLNSLSVISSDSVITKNTIDRIDYGFGNEGSRNLVFANQITNCGSVYSDPSKVYWPRATFPGNESGLIYGNNFINNYRNVECSKMTKIDSFNNGTMGNYWSDYDGPDSNGDGIGDTPYIIDANRSDLYPSISPFDITEASDLMPNWVQNLETLFIALADNGSTVALAVIGNVTNDQTSNVIIKTFQSAATTIVSFAVAGQSGSASYSNITIPTSAILYGTVPTVYVNGQAALDQGYTQDSINYYVWYTVPLSNYEVSIMFAGALVPTPTPIPEPTPRAEPFPTAPIIGFTVALALAVTIGLLLHFKKDKRRTDGSTNVLTKMALGHLSMDF